MNSRHQVRANQVWRRRKCKACKAIITTIEAVDTTQALQVRRNGHLEPFSRDVLLLSIYDSLRHRKYPETDATALTQTVWSNLLPVIQDAILDREQIIEVTASVLGRFDKAAATHYHAFHQS